MGFLMVATRPVRWIYELLFCLYCSLLYVGAKFTTGSRLIDKIADQLLSLDAWLDASHGHVFLSDHDRKLFYGVWWVITIIMFVALRLLGQMRFLSRYLPAVVVTLTVAGPLYFDLAASDYWHMPPYL